LALYQGSVELWYAEKDHPIRISVLPIKKKGNFVCFFQVPRHTDDGEVRHFLAITDAKESFAWSVDFGGLYSQDRNLAKVLEIRLVQTGELPKEDDMHLVSAVDPMGWRATISSESLDSYTREVLVTLSSEGCLQTWTTNLSRSKISFKWLNLSTVHTNITEASLVHGTSERKVAIGTF
jgi:hypothetical protein